MNISIKKSLHVFFLVSSGILLNACSSMPIYQALSTDAVVVNAKKNTPELTQEYTVDIGENLLVKESGSYLENKTQSVTLLATINYVYEEQPGVTKGKTTALGMTLTGGNAACYSDAQYRNSTIKFCLFDEDKNGFFEMGSFNGAENYALNIPYNIFSDDSQTPEKGYVKKTLSYKGLSNGKINFNYAEFSGNLVRATFSQDFSIENQKNAHILFNFKGAEVKIKKVDSLHITYEIIQYFK